MDVEDDRNAGFVLDRSAARNYHLKFAAGVAKLVYALDSKSSGLNAHVGSSPTSGTILPP